MTFRIKLWLAFAVTVSIAVGAVTWLIFASTERVFEEIEAQRTQALVSQFRFQLATRGKEIVQKVERIAGTEAMRRMSIDLGRTSADAAMFVDAAQEQASAQALDFLELVNEDGSIISSAHWPARFGYKLAWVPQRSDWQREGAFLQQVDLPEGVALGLLAAQTVRTGEKTLWVIGGRRMDKDFLATLSLPEGMRALLYSNLTSAFSAQNLTSVAGPFEEATILAPLVEQVRRQNRQTTETIVWPKSRSPEAFHALPLLGHNQNLLAVLLLGSSRRELVLLTGFIRGLGVGAVALGILLSLLVSWWFTRHLTHSVAQLAAGAGRVASGEWKTRVEVASQDEIGQLASAFNRMTHQLIEQREKLVQTERVAAWRELARRLAHELKNPLFPLQLTIENMQRARKHHSEQFDEVFREGTATLTTELSNLKIIIGRFSDFSRMPPPQTEPVNLNEVARQVLRLFDAQIQTGAPVHSEVSLDEALEPIPADPEQIKRALQNLVLNALDAMPDGGILKLRTARSDRAVYLEVSDSGSGLTPEERDRLFTPYYTTKRHGTGLGLAIVQSVVSDHGGKISVESEPGKGTTFRIELPKSSESTVQIPRSKLT